jgi:phosphoribosylanthranilate isomerase
MMVMKDPFMKEPFMTKIKFCGMTNLEDCEKAIELEVDFVGFVFYQKSPRYQPADEVKHIVDAIKGRVATVGVFVDENDEEIETILHHCNLDYCQVYRDTCLTNAISAYRIKNGNPSEMIRDDNGLILFDSYTEAFGGSGTSFDLAALRGLALHRAFIAGGINEQNVQHVLGLHPFGVDLVSSVEQYPGKKDHMKMESFMRKVRVCQH